MHLFVISNNFSTEVCEIYLKDGCIPRIGSQEPKLDAVVPCGDLEDTLSLEPAVWFKVQILDSISIDCNRRTVLWNATTLNFSESDQSESSSNESDTLPRSASCTSTLNSEGNQSDNACTSTVSLSVDDLVTSSESFRTRTDTNDTLCPVICIGDDGPSTPSEDTGHDSIKRDPSTRSTPRRRQRNERISESMYIGGECFGYDSDFDEIFEYAEQALTKFAEGWISGQKFNEELFRLLHIYILPSIRLSSDDIANLTDAIAAQERCITKLDNEILKVDDHIENVKRDLRKQRQRLVKEINEGSTPLVYPVEFAELLHKHINDDIEHSADTLDDLQKSVEVAKKSVGMEAKISDDDVLEVSADSMGSSLVEATGEWVSNGAYSSGSNGSSAELASRRRRRDSFFVSHEALLGARERLYEYLEAFEVDSKKKAKRSKLFSKKDAKTRKKSLPKNIDPKNTMYMGVESAIASMYDDIRALTDKKVLMISVKEAMRGALRELMTGEDTLGVDVDISGKQKSTDVLRHSRIPREWLTLTEQVASIISCDTSEICQEHRQFCDVIKERCRAVLYEKKLCELSREVTRCSDPPAICPVGQAGGIGVENKLYHLHSARSSTEDSGRSSNLSSISQLSVLSKSELPGYDRSISCDAASTKGAPQRGGLDSKQGWPAAGSSVGDKLSYTSSDLVDSSFIDSTEEGGVAGANPARRIMQLNGELGSQEVIMLHDRDVDYCAKSIEHMRKEITNNFNDICSAIQRELGHVDDQVNFRKIWQCYENHFYEETMPLLVQVYEQAHLAKCAMLCEAMPFLTVEDLDLSGIVFVNMLQDKLTLRPASGETPTLCDDVTSMRLDPESEPNNNVMRPGAQSFHKSWPATVKASNVNAVLASIAESNESVSALGGQPATSPLLSRRSHVEGDKRDKLHAKCPLAIVIPSLCSAGTGGDPDEAMSPGTSADGVDQLSPRTIQILYPQATRVVYDRRTWPQPQRVLPMDTDPGDIEEASEATSLDTPIPAPEAPENASPTTRPESKNCSPPTTAAVGGGKDIKLQKKYRDRFKETFNCIDSALKSSTPLLKLQYLTKCLREISHQVTLIQVELFGSSEGACSDDLIDLLVLLLCNTDHHTISRLYVHINMLSDLMAPFFSGGPFSFSLVQFSVAFQFLQDRLLVKKNKLGDSEV